MNSALMFSKASDNWSTPQDFYDRLDSEFRFQVDAASTYENSKCALRYGLDHVLPAWRDALAITWDERLPHWLNPPYSLCKEFVAKAAAERLRGVLTVMLIPSRTDTRYFHAHLWDVETHKARPGIELRFVKGRLKFNGAKASAPFPSMVVVFRP